MSSAIPQRRRELIAAALRAAAFEQELGEDAPHDGEAMDAAVAQFEQQEIELAAAARAYTRDWPAPPADGVPERSVHAVESSEDAPHERLTAWVEAIGAAAPPIEAVNGDVRLVVVATDDCSGGMMLSGYPDGRDGARDALIDLLGHVQAIARAYSLPLSIAQMPNGGGQG